MPQKRFYLGQSPKLVEPPTHPINLGLEKRIWQFFITEGGLLFQYNGQICQKKTVIYKLYQMFGIWATNPCLGLCLK